MSQIKGVAEAVSCKEGNDHPKYGKSYQVSIKVDDEWYGAFTKKTADQLGIGKGRLVSFTYTENGKYKNFDPKSLVVSESAETASGKSTTGGNAYSGSTGSAGIKVGHAINNAVALVASGKVPVEDSILRTIHGQAVRILALSVKLEAQFNTIIASAEDVYAKATDSSSINEPTATASVPKRAAKTRAKAKPAPVQEPDPEQQQDDDEDDLPPDMPQEVEAEPDFDDDIPFC